MEDHWRPDRRSTVPNDAVYPWSWLWDSCFHALIWDALGDSRATVELASVFEAQTPSGFVPHMSYAADPGASVELWGRRGASTITQPPMYGHAIAVLAGHGRDVGALLEPATRALHHLFAAPGPVRARAHLPSVGERHRRPSPLGRLAAGPVGPAGVGPDQEPVGAAAGRRRRRGRRQPAFDVCPAGFNALVAFNAFELASVTGDGELRASAAEVAATLDRAWVDDGSPGPTLRRPGGPGRPSGPSTPCCRPWSPRSGAGPRRPGAALDPAQFGLPFGPAGVHPAEASYAPDGYGRGSAWPHLITCSGWRPGGPGRPTRPSWPAPGRGRRPAAAWPSTGTPGRVAPRARPSRGPGSPSSSRTAGRARGMGIKRRR